MIIRPVCKREFVALPNAVLTDTRLSIETRGMLAFILSKPKTWQIRPVPLAQALSSRETQLGRTKLDRMFKEATAAGYMARSVEQARKADGSFDSYVYLIGMPEDVASEAQAFERECDISTARTLPAAGDPYTANVQRILEKTDPENTDDIFTRGEGLISKEAQRLAEDCLTALGFEPQHPPIELVGLAYQTSIMLSRGYDPVRVVAAFARFAGQQPIKPLTYFVKVVETACSAPPLAASTRSAENGQYETIRNGLVGRITEGPRQSNRSPKEQRWAEAFDNVERQLGLAQSDDG